MITDAALALHALRRAGLVALIDARGEANKIVAEARAAIQKDLDKATAKADAEISAKTAESAARSCRKRALGWR